MGGPRIALVAGEASGDQLGASLIHAARAIRPDLQFEGIAGPQMRAAGCDAWFDSQALAVMGVFEVLGHLPRLLKIKKALERRLINNPPDVFVGIDAPDFNLRVEQRLRKAGIPTVHYVSPSVWAWRKRRVNTLRRACDLVLCLLPFEASFLERHNVAAEFVGHPLADILSADKDAARARRDLGINAERLIAILPGSRIGEVTRLGADMARAADWLSRRLDGVSFAAPMASPELKALFESQWQQHAAHCPVQLFDGRAHDVIAASDAVLTTSGTATLETMLLNRPMVVVYKMSEITFRMRGLTALRKLKYFSLPNLLAGRELVPELLQHDVTPESMGRALEKILQSREYREEMSREFALLRQQLERSAAEQAAHAVLRTAGLI